MYLQVALPPEEAELQASTCICANPAKELKVSTQLNSGQVASSQVVVFSRSAIQVMSKNMLQLSNQSVY